MPFQKPFNLRLRIWIVGSSALTCFGFPPLASCSCSSKSAWSYCLTIDSCSYYPPSPCSYCSSTSTCYLTLRCRPTSICSCCSSLEFITFSLNWWTERILPWTPTDRKRPWAFLAFLYAPSSTAGNYMDTLGRMTVEEAKGSKRGWWWMCDRVGKVMLLSDRWEDFRQGERGLLWVRRRMEEGEGFFVLLFDFDPSGREPVRNHRFGDLFTGEGV